VVPIAPRADWEQTKAFCRTFAEAMSQEEPHRFLPTPSKAERRGRILIDYLRNGLGNTAIGSFCPRARPGATVAMPLSWKEVKPGLDPAAFTIRTVPDLLRRWRRDPWEGFRDAAKPISELARQPRIATAKSAAARAKPAPGGGRVSGIVVAHKPRRRG
jgi:bifunctional non-homologous end joining protein LigD